MIEYISGNIVQLTPTNAVIDINGIGYDLNISLTTFTALQDKPKAKLLVHEIIREDTHLLYGFADERERVLFRLLIGVSGVGANIARMILSGISPSELEQVIVSGADKRLKSVKGVGAKTAQRIIVDLRDKIKPSDDTLFIEQPAMSETAEEATAALVVLGFPKPAVEKVLRKVFAEEPAMKVDAAIRKALSML